MAAAKMILDVDTGIDDALALLFALKSDEIGLEGITTVFGNVSAEQATRNTLAVLELSGAAEDIPVAMGAAGPLFGEWGGTVESIHDRNGIGGYELPEPKKQAIAEFAPDFIVRKLNEQPGEITLVFVGRLTNLAIALAKDPTIASKAKRLVLMGGALYAPGNVTPVAEANIWGDPEAAHRVFESGIPITMVGLDVTMEAVLRDEDVRRFKELAAGPGQEPLVRFVDAILKYYFEAYEQYNGCVGRIPMHDPLAVAVAEDPSLVDTEPHYIAIETKGRLSAGATLSDRRKASAFTEINASVCVRVDRDRFVDRLLKVLAAQPLSAQMRGTD
ncbi:nucleoside hydrolase [Cohnella sp. CFH 77786]|uniref:nucleoside hydrolase n=1 Tax=Cohnella sp. CFH 77786 TaxID=2662265 RepID=UPI001C608748|nr:nucleoside hydrolase [Cohnella sp. CFH 77786]MBW5449091.1 nucleoside hydrolase [Cohnella sp. CFH 77786]